MRQTRLLTWVSLALALACAPVLRAQIQPAPQPEDQPDAQYGSQMPPPPQAQPQAQATGVGRISLVQGGVSTQRGDSGDWNAAIVNTPVVPGDRVSTGDRSRAEVQLDFGNVLRLDEHTVVRVTQLDPQHIQMEISEGLVDYTSLPSSGADVEIDTPNLAIHPQRDGMYRIQVNSDGETLVSVRRGLAEVGTAEGSTTVHAGELIDVRGDASNAQYRISVAPSRDPFDQWSEERDRLLQRSQSSQYLNPYYTGGADLDSYGTWQNVPDYGNVWAPSNVPPDWAPYQDGSWVWEPYWGWTWVSYEPWGWAPYHYGRWFLWNSSWVWWPGPVYPFYRPLWAPAYVGFFGFGPGLGFGFSSFGWLPLGPADPFFPWWGGFGLSFNFFRFGEFSRFGGGRGFIPPLAGPLRGRTMFSNLNGLETSARLRAAITSVSAARFGNGRVVPERHSFTAAEIRGAQLARGGLPVVPGRGSLSATGRPAAAGTVPARNLSAQHFMSHSRPAAAPHSFAVDSAQIRQQIERQRSSPGGGGRGTGRPSPSEAPRSFDSPRSSLAGSGGGFGSLEANRGVGGSAANESPARGGAERSFTQSRPAATTESRAYSADTRGNWQRFTPQQSPSGFMVGRSSASSPQSFQNSQRFQGRAPLDLHHSIVQERSPSYGSSRGPASGGANSYYSAPRSQPEYRAPETPRGYSAAPHYSAPSAPRGNYGGGGGYRGGGGNRGGGASHGGGGSHGGGSHGGSSHPSGGHHSGRR